LLAGVAVGPWGIIGVGAAYLAATVLAEGLFLNAIAGRHAGSGLGEFARTAILPNLALGAVTYAAGRLLLPFIPDRGYPTLFLSFALVSVFHGAIAALFLVERDHLRRMTGYVTERASFALKPATHSSVKAD